MKQKEMIRIFFFNPKLGEGEDFILNGIKGLFKSFSSTNELITNEKLEFNPRDFLRKDLP